MAKIKLGVFGLWRGGSFLDIINAQDDAEVYAICDKDEDKLNASAARLPEHVLKFTNFDEFIECGMDGVLLCNYFHQHAEFAIRAMERGIHVFSECTSGATLRDCVLLCEAVERTGCKYMIAENYPFSPALLEMERLNREGTLGRILYAEGEYNHTATKEDLRGLTPGEYHWRGWMPRTYYVTHALGPLMHITKQMPVKVNAFAVHSDVLEEYDDFRHNYDALAMMNCITDDGALFRFTGCTAMCSPSGYRICGEFGGAETGRTLGSKVNVTYHSWTTPEGKPQSETYAPESHAEAAKTGHGGGDYWMVRNFVDYIVNDIEPFFNVYRGCAMSAVGILAWRSCMEDGKTYYIPDFTNPEERNKVRDDVLTPFPDENGNVTLPCAIGKKMNPRKE